MAQPVTQGDKQGRSTTRASGARGSGLVARWAGGVAALVLFGSGAAGLGLGAYTARVHGAVRARVVAGMRDSLAARVDAQTRVLAAELGQATEQEDWTRLQATLPNRAAGDPAIVLLAATDGDGLVLAASHPADNGRPLHDAHLRPVLAAADGVPVLIELDGEPVLVAARRVPLDDRDRVAWAGISFAEVRTVERTLADQAHAAITRGWWVVFLSGFVVAAVGVGAVLLVGGSLARGLRVVAWRISELGRGDRSTHVRLDGSSELEHIGVELERAAERLAKASERAIEKTTADRDRQALDALRERLLPTTATVDGVRITMAGTAPRHAAALAARRTGVRTLVTLIEVVGERIEDALLAAELRATAMTSELVDPAALVSLLDKHAAGQHARAVVVALDEQRAIIGNAGGRFVLHRHGESELPIVVRGDRLGEEGAKRDGSVTIELAPTDALVLSLEDRAQLVVERAPAAQS